MKSKYQSSKSVAKNQTVPISVDDPRLAWDKIGQTKARQGAEIDIVGLDGKSLVEGGRGLISPTGTNGIDNSKRSKIISIPPYINQPGYDLEGYELLIPTAPTNVTAVWAGTEGEDLVISFDWDYSNDLNKTVSNFIVEIVSDGVTQRTPIDMFIPNKTQTAQTITLTKDLNRKAFNSFITDITSICVLSLDPFYNVSESACVQNVPVYNLDLPIPQITVTAINSGYSVAYTTPTKESYNSIEIVEYESNSSTEPTGVTYTRTYLGIINPANIIAANTNTRWVKASFHGDSGKTTPFSAAQKVTPTNPVSVDLTPPNEVVSVSGVWSGDDIVVSYTLPVTDPASRIQIQLTAPNNLVGYFYRFPTGSGAQTTIITKKDLFDQFGEHYSSFSGVLRSIDSADNRSSGVSFNVATRANPLVGIVPTFTTVALSNAYSVNFTIAAGASFAEVYAKHTPWVGDPTDDTYLVYAGLSPAVITDIDYTTIYIKIRYYDDFGNTSSYSAEGTVTPIDPGLITSFENPISFGENAVIYAGNSATSGTRTLFKAGGIFAYDATNTSPSTQIVSNASAGTPTFITTQAQIADWNITDTKIENTLTGTPTKYTGLSATGTYAFWAGSDVTGGNSSASFTVTPEGAVTARNIAIIGNGNASSNLISAGGLFTVKNDGSLTATSATITGNITASSGSFTGNVSIGSGGSLYALGSGGSVNSGIRTIFNSSGVAAYNGLGGYAQMLTTPLADGSVFATTAANIGGWSVDSNRIYKTSAGGRGNIVIDSSNGYLYVGNANTIDYSAGINSASSSSSVAFWAGSAVTDNKPDPSKQTISGKYDNSFVVRMDGKLFASSAEIKGTLAGGSKTSATDNTNAGYYLDNSGTFNLGGSDAYVKYASGQITIGTSNPNTPNAATAYPGETKIVFGSFGTLIYGLPVQGNEVTNYYGQTQLITQSGYYNSSGVLQDNTLPIGSGGTSYMGMNPLGPLARQRMIVENPVTGALNLGMAVYYEDTSGVHTADPTGSTGYVGDLWVQY